MIFFRRLNMNWWNASIYIIKYNNNYILTHAYFLTTYSIIKKILRKRKCIFVYSFFFFIPSFQLNVDIWKGGQNFLFLLFFYYLYHTEHRDIIGILSKIYSLILSKNKNKVIDLTTQGYDLYIGMPCCIHNSQVRNCVTILMWTPLHFTCTLTPCGSATIDSWRCHVGHGVDCGRLKA